MALFESSIEKAAGQVRKLNEVRAMLETLEQSAAAELATLQGGLGELELEGILNGVDTAPAHQRIETLNRELTTVGAAQIAIVPRIEAAVQSLNAATGADIRRKADKLEEALQKRIEKANGLRKQLEEFEECAFIPDMEPRGDLGVNDAGMVVQLGPQIIPPAPRSLRMKSEVEQLRAQAAGIESRKPGQGGHVNGVNLEELLTALHDQVLAPSETSVRTWFTAAKARADEQWLTERECSREPEPPRTVTYQVVWNGAGTINPHESTVTNSITPARFVRAA